MNVSYVTSVLLLGMLVFCALSHSSPEPFLKEPQVREPLMDKPLSQSPDNAKHMWNGEEKYLRHLRHLRHLGGRHTRRTVEQKDQPRAFDIPGEEYIIDLYNSRTMESVVTQANTIKSLKYNKGNELLNMVHLTFDI